MYNLLDDNPKKLFLRYLFPSISATLVTSIYVLADTIIIGQGVGASGIAALNIILPIFTLFFGTGYLFGVGGAVLMSFTNGKGNPKLANTYFTTAVICAVLFTIIYFIVFNLFFEQIVYFMGSTESNIELVKSYGKYIVMGCPLFVASSLLQTFIRNDKAPKLAMTAVVSGGILNVILDYIFVFEFNMGMAGAAIATLIGTAVTVIILLSHFISKHNNMKICLDSFKFKIIAEIFQSGLSSFIIEIASGVIVFLFNIQLLKFVGEIGVVVYGIISNSAIIAMSLFNGVAQATQPIMAVNFGAKKIKRVLKIRKFGIIFTMSIGFILFLLGFLFPQIAISIFVEPTQEILSLGITAIRIYFTAFLMMNLNILYITYFQSIMQPQITLFICLLRGLLLSTILVFLLPVIFGVTGIWIVMPLTELITLGVSLMFIKNTDKLLE